jgi:hypothetical protein
VEFIPADDEKGPGLTTEAQGERKRAKQAGLRNKSAYGKPDQLTIFKPSFFRFSIAKSTFVARIAPRASAWAAS